MTEFPSQKDYSNNLIFSNIRTLSISCSTSILEAQLYFFLLPNNRNGQKKKKNAVVQEEETPSGVSTSELFLISAFSFFCVKTRSSKRGAQLITGESTEHIHFILWIFLWSLLRSLVKKYVTFSTSNHIYPSILPLLRSPSCFVCPLVLRHLVTSLLNISYFGIHY